MMLAVLLVRHIIFLPGPLDAEDGPLSWHSSAIALRMFDINLRLTPKRIKNF